MLGKSRSKEACAAGDDYLSFGSYVVIHRIVVSIFE